MSLSFVSIGSLSANYHIGTDLLVIIDLLQVGIERIREASSNEVGLRVVGQTFLVELTLEILECKSIVQDGHIASWGRVVVHGNITLLNWSGSSEASREHWKKV